MKHFQIIPVEIGETRALRRIASAMILGLALFVFQPTLAAQPLANGVFTGGTSAADQSGRNWAYLAWQATDESLLQGHTLAIYRKEGIPSSVNSYAAVSVVARRTDAVAIASLLDRSVNLGENLVQLKGSVSNLFEKVVPPGSMTLAQMLAAILGGSLTTDQAGQLAFLSRTHPGIGMCLGLAYAELMPTNATTYTYEIRDWDPVKQQDLGVLGRVTITAHAPVILPAPGAPVLVPEQTAKGHLRSKLRWAAPDPLRRLAVLSFGYNVYRMDRAFAESHNYHLSPPFTPDLLNLLGSNPSAVKRVNDNPVLPPTDFSAAQASNLDPATGDPKTFFIADVDGRYEPGYSGVFTNGQQFYYFVTARDILGRDGVVSPGTLVTTCDRLPPPVPEQVQVVNDYRYDTNLHVGTQSLKVVWNQNVNDTNKTTVNYYVYRWISVTEMFQLAGNPLAHRIAGPIPHIPGQEQNSYLDIVDVPQLPSPKLPQDAGKTFWYTVRAEDNGACGPNLSGNSGPAYGVLRDRVGPDAPNGLLSILCFKPTVSFLPPTSDRTDPTLNPAANNFQLTCTRTNSDIAWAEFAILPAGGSNASMPLIAFDSVWHYDQSGADLGTAWNETGYNDAAWSAGQSLLGYNLSPSRFPVPFRTVMPPRPGGGPVTTYFRTHFTFPSGATAVSLTASNLVDDGAVFYLNGTEVGRLRIPQPTAYNTLSGRQIGEGQVEVLNFPTSVLVLGDNVLAVEVHQVYATNRDMAFGMALNATATASSGTNPISIRRVYFPDNQNTVSVNFAADPNALMLPTFSCVVGTATGRASDPAYGRAGWPPSRTVRTVNFVAGTQMLRTAPANGCLVHDPRPPGAGSVQGIDITVLTNATAKEYRIYRRVDEGPLTLIRQGEFGQPAEQYEDAAMPLNAATICYYIQVFDEQGNPSPLVRLDPCLRVAGTVPTPILSQISATNTPTAPQMSVQWFCPPYGVDRFEVWISSEGDPLSASPSDSLALSNTPVTLTVQVEGTNTTRDFQIFRTPHVGIGFGDSANGSTFQVNVGVKPSSRYLVFVRAIASDGAAGARSNVKAYQWMPGSINALATDPVPWPSRPLPPTAAASTFNSGIQASYLALPGRFTGLGVRIGAVMNPADTNDVGTNNIIQGTKVTANSLATTASMDTGITNTLFSWYERGFNHAFPTSGLPVAGSTFTAQSVVILTNGYSTNSAGGPVYSQNVVGYAYASYRMAPSYLTNDAVLIDSVSQNATLTLTSPASYGALSFLASCSTGTVRIAYTLHYLDGTAESDVIGAEDWMSDTAGFGAPAWTANGNANVRSFAFGSVNSGFPRLYSVPILLANTNSILLSVDLQYVSGNGHGCILALSGLPFSQGNTFLPINFTGYNQDMIIEANPAGGGIAGPGSGPDIPSAFIYTNANPGDLILPLAMYRYQVATPQVPDVSGALIQVTPLMEEIAYRNSSSYPGIEIRDPFIALQWVNTTAGPHQDIYLLDTQPVIQQAAYSYVLVRFKSNHEIDKVFVTQPVSVP
jgi:hypothetical protein